MPKFKAPTGGFYLVTESIVMYRKTGNFEKVLNPRRKYFFQFWIPKYIEREILELIHEQDNEIVKFFTPGETIESPMTPIRLKE